jgi:tRNA threonylcarbamoyladenosine biosynthesis protein TsaB
LAWDTSTKSGTIAALEWSSTLTKPRIVAEFSLNVDTTHSERLLWAIHAILEACRWKLSDIDYFAVGVGPGSFTGLRIGVTTARTLADALNKPLIGVSSLAALARPVAVHCSALDQRVIVVASTDACKGELFSLVGSAKSILDCVALPDGDFAGLWKRGVEETVMRPEELIKTIKKKMLEGGKKNSPIGFTAVGDGRERYLDEWKKLKKSSEIEFSVPGSNQIQGRFVALLAWQGIQAGIARSGLQVFPRYLRASDAEIKLKAGLLPKLLKAKGAWSV